MERFFKRYGWAVHLAVIAMIASLVGWTINQGIATQLAPLTIPELASAPAPGGEPKTTRRPSRQNFKSTIIRHCLFECADDAEGPPPCDPECADGELCQNGTCIPATPNAPVDSQVPVLSDLNIKLLGAMVARRPSYSLALLEDGSNTLILGVGDTVGPEQAEIIEIRRDRIILRRNGRLEYIKLANSIGGTPSASPKLGDASSFSPAALDLKRGESQALTSPPTASLKPAPMPIPTIEPAGVTQVSDSTFEIDRATLEKELSDPKALAKQARIVPNLAGGRPDGIKVIGVNSESAFYKIGLRNGDVVRSINGNKVTNQARALELIQGLRSASGASIDIERRGSSTTLNYKVK